MNIKTKTVTGTEVEIVGTIASHNHITNQVLVTVKNRVSIAQVSTTDLYKPDGELPAELECMSFYEPFEVPAAEVPAAEVVTTDEAIDGAAKKD